MLREANLVSFLINYVNDRNGEIKRLEGEKIVRKKSEADPLR